MSKEIDNVCTALERLIVELQVAGNRAKLAGDRAAERSLIEYKSEEIKTILRNLKGHTVEYLKQPRFAKYFNS